MAGEGGVLPAHPVGGPAGEAVMEEEEEEEGRGRSIPSPSSGRACWRGPDGGGEGGAGGGGGGGEREVYSQPIQWEGWLERRKRKEVLVETYGREKEAGDSLPVHRLGECC